MIQPRNLPETRREYWIVFARRTALVLLAVALVEGLLALRPAAEDGAARQEPAREASGGMTYSVAHAGILLL